MTDAESPILKPPSRARSRPSTPGASFLHATSLSVPTKHFPNTAEITKTFTPNALISSLPSPVNTRRLEEPEPASRSKISLTLSLPEEKTFGQPSIDLPGLDFVRDFGFGSGAVLKTSRIDERRSVVVEEGVKEGGNESFDGVNLERHERQIRDRGNELGAKDNEPEAVKEKTIAELLDRREDEEEDKDNRVFSHLKTVWGNIAGKCGCF